MNLTQLLADAEDRLFPALGLTPQERALYIHLLRLAVCRDGGRMLPQSPPAPSAPEGHEPHWRQGEGSPGSDPSPSQPFNSSTFRPSIIATKRQLAQAIGVCSSTVRHVMRHLARAGCIRITGLLGRRGFSLEVLLPSEILGVCHAERSEASALALPSEILRGCHPEERSDGRELHSRPSEGSAFSLPWPSQISDLESEISPPLPPTTDHRPPSSPPSPSTFQPLNFSTPRLLPKRGRGRSTGRFRSKSLRAACFNREQARCFYCLRSLRPGAWSLDHVVPAAAGGDDSPHNAVATCHECNCRKGEMNAADFLRSLYRRGLLTASELESRLAALRALCAPAH